MNITDIRIFPVGDAKLKAFVSIILDHCFLISGIKIIEGNTGLFLSMPSKKRKDGTFKDIAHPLNSETRNRMEEQILAKYHEVSHSTAPAPAAVAEDLAEEGIPVPVVAPIPAEAVLPIPAPVVPPIPAPAPAYEIPLIEAEPPHTAE